MEHYKSRNNDYFHFTNPRDDVSDFDDDESQYYDVDDRSCDFNFQTSGVNDDTVEFGIGALMFQLDGTMNNIKRVIDGIGTQISHLEDTTCKLDNCVEDVKNYEQRYHGTTHRKLRQMQTVLQQVHDDVLFLRDKHEVAETRLQLAFLRGSKRDEINISPQSSCSTPFLNQQSNELALSQAVSYHPVVLQPHEIRALQYVIPPNQKSHTLPQNKPDLQFPHFVQSQLSNTSFFHTSNPRNYKSEFHAKYMPEFASFSNMHLHGENVKPVELFLRPPEESSRRNYIHTPVAKTLPHALPTAIDVKEVSRSEENGHTIPVDEIVGKVTGMGFRRDLVRSCVRKLAVDGSRVDLNSVLDKMMNDK